MKVKEIKKRITDIENSIHALNVVLKVMESDGEDDYVIKLEEAICQLGNYKYLLNRLMDEAKIDI